MSSLIHASEQGEYLLRFMHDPQFSFNLVDHFLAKTVYACPAQLAAGEIRKFLTDMFAEQLRRLKVAMKGDSEGKRGAPEREKIYLKLKSISKAILDFNISRERKRLGGGKGLTEGVLKRLKKRFNKVYERNKLH